MTKPTRQAQIVPPLVPGDFDPDGGEDTEEINALQGLDLCLAIPAIVAIHLFRRRFPVRPVAGLFLWQLGRQTPEGGGKISRLPITRSLILECLAALALALILPGAPT